MASTPHYIAEKVGDQYVLVRKDVLVSTGKPELCIGGIALLLAASFGRGGGRLAFWLLGSAMLTMGLSCRGKPCGGSGRGRGKVREMSRGPSYPHEDAGLQPRQKPSDPVDEAVME